MNQSDKYKQLQIEIGTRKKQNLPVKNLLKEQYKIMLASYVQFCESIAKEPEAETLSRYAMELQYLDILINISLEAGLPLDKLQNKVKKIRKHIETTFGVSLDEING